MSLRELILNTKPKLVPVECPAWGCTIYVDGSLSLADRLEVARLSRGEGQDFTIPMVILSARDESGARLFTSEDAEALAAIPDGEMLSRIALAALNANGWGADGTESARKN